ncbi:MAG: NUDIX hydrolase [Polaromonas sp.]|nr:MAG: NUDIX hydrolase [Polaromonas sp.]
MELNLETVNHLPLSAATVIMLRDDTHGLEVFLIKRHIESSVLGGVFVFPGGKVDRLDARLNAALHIDQPLLDLHIALHEPDIDHATAAGLYVAAVREVFEESGILFAQGVGLVQAERATAMMREGMTFAAVLANMQLRLQTSSLVPWSRWITPTTPSVTNKRFDTRFFIAAVPAGQIATHDNFEATESVWLKPRAALEWQRDGLIEMAPPQIMTLAHISRFENIRAAMCYARSNKPPVIQPHAIDIKGVRVICYPGDEQHPVKEKAMPGPTRLQYHNKLFKPLDGFETLFI